MTVPAAARAAAYAKGGKSSTFTAGANGSGDHGGGGNDVGRGELGIGGGGAVF